MQSHIIAACAAMSLQRLRSVSHFLIERFQRCTDASSHHFEHLLELHFCEHVIAFNV